VTLRDAWEDNAVAWIRWARSPEHDHHFWRFNGPRFLELLPPAGRLTIDVGCGEGRLTRELADRGHHVVGIESSPTLAAGLDVREADAASLPLGDDVADLVVAFMSLLNLDDMDAAIGEAARVLVDGGRLCLAVPHPVSSGGLLDDRAAGHGSYFERRRFVDTRERDGLRMDFHDVHRPLEEYVRSLSDAGLLVERLSEPVPYPDHVAERPHVERWLGAPCYLHLRAVLPAT
jgi:SAM-dependent methyltransferase